MSSSNNVLSRKVIFSCFLSSCLEIYDFAIFGFLTVIINKNYLSFLDEKTATFTTYAFFAVGFVFRSVGSLIFGYIGDVYGRKKALVTSVSMMGIASFIMFILPPYSVIGIVSCYIIILVRIIQGISVGGEFTGAIIFAVEHNKTNNVGFVTGIVSAGGACGIILANLVSNLLQHPSLPDYSWRFAFLVGFALAFVGYFIRKKLSDTPLFTNNNKAKIPLFEGLKFFKLESLATFWVAAANGTVVYFGTVYLVKFVQEVKKDLDSGFIPILVGSVIALGLPVFGMLSDKINRQLFLITSSIVMGLYSLIVLHLVVGAQSIDSLSLFVFLFALLASLMISSINIFAIEIFPVAYRMSCCSLFYSLGMGFIGGTIPMVSSYILKNIGTNISYLGFYIASICFLASGSVFLVYRKHLKHKVFLNEIDFSKNVVTNQSYKINKEN